VLPYDRFETDKWNTMDADVRFKGKRIEHGSTLPISDLTTHIILQNADLKLQPLKFGLAGGTISPIFALKGIKADAGAGGNSGAAVKLKQLMPTSS
jgi:uncharacterized protein involved in outer membrane biogenesis